MGFGDQFFSYLAKNLKEAITALIGITIVLGTLILLWPVLSGSSPDIETAQGIFSILGGWGGVVLGYYFGRIPAEKAADKAEDRAEKAEKNKYEAVESSRKILKETSDKITELENKFLIYRETIGVEERANLSDVELRNQISSDLAELSRIKKDILEKL